MLFPYNTLYVLRRKRGDFGNYITALLSSFISTYTIVGWTDKEIFSNTDSNNNIFMDT